MQNIVKTAVQLLFAKQAFVPLCIAIISPFMTCHNISLPFRVAGRRVSKFPFFTKFRLALVLFCFNLLRYQFWCDQPSIELVWTVIPQTFQGKLNNWPGVNNRIFPKWGSEEVRNDTKFYLVSTVWPPGPPKVRWCRFFFAKKISFLGFFFLGISILPANGWLSHVACHTYLESYDT